MNKYIYHIHFRTCTVLFHFVLRQDVVLWLSVMITWTAFVGSLTHVLFSFLQWLSPDLLSTQDLRKQVAPLLKSFQGEVSKPLCSLYAHATFCSLVVTFLTAATAYPIKATYRRKVYCGSQFKGIRSIMLAGGMAAGVWGYWLPPLLGSREMDSVAQLAFGFYSGLWGAVEMGLNVTETPEHRLLLPETPSHPPLSLMPPGTPPSPPQTGCKDESRSEMPLEEANNNCCLWLKSLKFYNHNDYM